MESGSLADKMAGDGQEIKIRWLYKRSIHVEIKWPIRIDR